MPRKRTFKARSTSTTEYLLVAALVIALALLANPFFLLFTSTDAMALIVIAVFLAIVYVTFVVNERAQSQRDYELHMLAGRGAYIAVIATLSLALLVQGFDKNIDPWIPIALAVTVLSKLITRAWFAKEK